MTFIVRVVDTDLGYADEETFGPFRLRDAARRFADRVEARVKRDDVRVLVDQLAAPVLGGLSDRGWFDGEDA